MNIVGIIPARMASQRFPGKPLAQIRGLSMIKHVYLRSKMAPVLDDLYIATCDKEIEDHCLQNNMKVIMTKDTHTRASDRASEAMLKIEKLTGTRIDIPVMIQGDEPMLDPQMLAEVIDPIRHDKTLAAANLMAHLTTEDERNDPNIVKAVTDLNNCALYFSREPIPSNKKQQEAMPVYKQIAIIPFHRDMLIKFNQLEETPLEISESVDMLRLVENGYKVKMVLTKFNIYGVDTPADLIKVEKLMKLDELFSKYGNAGTKCYG